MTKRTKKLSLAKETLRSLADGDLRRAAGAADRSYLPGQCPFKLINGVKVYAQMIDGVLRYV